MAGERSAGDSLITGCLAWLLVLFLCSAAAAVALGIVLARS